MINLSTSQDKSWIENRISSHGGSQVINWISPHTDIIVLIFLGIIGIYILLIIIIGISLFIQLIITIMERYKFKKTFTSNSRLPRSEINNMLPHDPETFDTIAHINRNKVITKTDKEGEYINIEFRNLEVGKKYFVEYNDGQYIISKTPNGDLLTSEVRRKEKDTYR
jgi:hypothetical protein